MWNLNMKEKLKDLIHSKYFIPILCCIPLALVVLSALLVLMWYAFLAEAFIWTVGVVKLYWRTMLALPGLVLGFFAFLRYVIPVLTYIISRPLMYLSLWSVCKKCACRMKITRMPFASLSGVKERADIVITTPTEKLCLHMVDVVFRFRRVVIFHKEGHYLITPTIATGATLVGAAMGSVFSDEPVELTNQKKVMLDILTTKKRTLPDFSRDKECRHFLILQTNPVDARFDTGLENHEICSGTKVGMTEFYYLKRFKREMLKGERRLGGTRI